MDNTLLARSLVLVGLGAVALGITVAVAPGIAVGFGATDSVLTLIGLVALVQSARSASDYWNHDRAQAALPDADSAESAVVQGERFDHVLALSGRRGSVGDRYRRRLRREVRRAAVETLAAETGASDGAIRRSLEAGTWTDDPVAAALFTEEPAGSWRDRIRTAVGRETTFQRRVRRAVAAIERRVEAERDG